MRVGFDTILGHLAGGFAAWTAAERASDTVCRITASEFAERLKTGEVLVIDIRKEREYSTKHLADAQLCPLADLNNWLVTINPQQHFFLHCAGGYRSMIAASILQARGYRNFTEIEGGFAAIAKIDALQEQCVSEVG
jgi:hydroxyacylglutathione hydrolase